jgi:hypothetical protein
MAAINFPNSPTSGQVFTVGDITWTWDSTDTVWRSTTLGVHATSHELGGIDEVGLAQSQVTGLPLFNVSSPANAQALVYNQATQRWVNSAVSGESFSPLLLMGA